MTNSAVIMMIIAAVSSASWLLTYNRIPIMITDWASVTVNSQFTFLLAVIFLLLLVGLFS